MPKFLIRKRTWILTISVVFVFFACFSNPLLLNQVRSRISQGLLIPLNLLSKTSQYLYSKNTLYRENRLLRGELGQLYLRVGQLSQLEDENERLRALLKFKEKFKFSAISCEVIARNPNNWIDTFIINKGSLDGVRRNAAVCSEKGLVGKVVENGENTSSVMLITHPSFKVGGMFRDTRVTSIVAGTGKGMVKMLYLPMDAEIAKGDIVVTSDFSRIFPKGITIGEVVLTAKSRTGLYKYAIIKPSAASFGEEEVLCIK